MTLMELATSLDNSTLNGAFIQMVGNVYDNPQSVYHILKQFGLPADSYLREQLFSYLADNTDKDYDYFYNKWLEGDK